ncbi:MAG TPA: DUF1080 domain-containing protein [Gemmataceae bacterium]|nr:DUF1080 domain-containing protein [Gemmataceae bacterium]
MRQLQRFPKRAALAFLAEIALFAIGSAAAADGTPEKSAVPPKDAIVLFDGKDLSGWTKRNGQPAGWKVEDGYMEVVPRQGDIMTKQKFGPDFQLHVEFWLPSMPNAKGQARANSGVYIQGRYEVQVLDSYMNKTYADGACGALYKIIAPNWAAAEEKGQSEPKNPCKPPEQWQTYDITFHAPRVNSQGAVSKNGQITIVQNGVTVIDHGTFGKATDGALDTKLGEPGPIRLQDHGNKVRFRNIWLKPL